MSAHRGRRPLRALAIACVGLGLVTGAPGAGIPAGERRSGYEFMSRETRAMQDDDVTNPGMLWVLDGEALWNRKDGAAARACGDCHGDARASMKGVAARHPAWDAASGRPVNLEQRINACRTGRQRAAPLAYESRELLALAAYVALQSRGMPAAVAIDDRTRPYRDAGRDAFIGYSPYVRPMVIGGVKCVMVDARLRELERMAFDFVMNFAKDNDLPVYEGCVLPEGPQRRVDG